MADESSKKSGGERVKARRKAEIPEVAELEKRVHLKELQAREAEAEVRYLEAAAKRKSLRSGKKETKANKKAASAG
jgi:hypothetical protein